MTDHKTFLTLILVPQKVLQGDNKIKGQYY